MHISSHCAIIGDLTPVKIKHSVSWGVMLCSQVISDVSESFFAFIYMTGTSRTWVTGLHSVVSHETTIFRNLTPSEPVRPATGG
jgi:hypothetical protein